MRAMHQTLSVYKSDFICLCDINDYVVNKAAKSSSPIIFSLGLILRVSYKSVSQTSSFSTVVILCESETFRPVRKNCKSKNSVSPLQVLDI